VVGSLAEQVDAEATETELALHCISHLICHVNTTPAAWMKELSLLING